MKRRHGFVSNSSSTSFCISSNAYATVSDLAIAMLDIRNSDWGSGTQPMSHDQLSKELIIIKNSPEKNRPTAFSTTNYSTFIIPFPGMYLIETCHNHTWTLRGSSNIEMSQELIKFLKMDEEDIDNVDLNRADFWNLKYELPFWWPEFDRTFRIHQRHGPTLKRCTKHEHANIIWLQENGKERLVCASCEFGIPEYYL